MKKFWVVNKEIIKKGLIGLGVVLGAVAIYGLATKTEEVPELTDGNIVEVQDEEYIEVSNEEFVEEDRA